MILRDNPGIPAMSQFATVYTASYPRDLYAGVRTRRLFAWMLDALIVAFLTLLVASVLAVATIGLSLFILPPLFPAIAVLYHAITVSGSGRGTIGMRAMDLEDVMSGTGARAPFINAAAQALLFYLSWAFPLLFVVTLIDREKRFLHDMLSSLVVVRRPN
jgi:uncharacterized RDD family membrane protein YckC